MLNFKELPKNGVLFEQLIRELLVLDGYKTFWTGVGQDGGKDLVVVEELVGSLSEYERKWLINCKHFAHSGKSVNKDHLGNISEDCKAIGAEGYILACSTQPTSGLLNRFEEIQKNQNIIIKFWDSIEIEKRLTKPNTFRLIHTFFPKSSQTYRWQIYNTYSPTFWAANYKTYFFYMSSRLSNKFPPLKCIENLVKIIEKIPIYKGNKKGINSHYLKLRSVYYDDKYGDFIVYLDYLYPETCDEKLLIPKSELYYLLQSSFNKNNLLMMNVPNWDVLYLPGFMAGDEFDYNHKSYYLPYLKDFESGIARVKFIDEYLIDENITDEL